MTKRRRGRRKRSRKQTSKARRPTGGIQLVTPEGDALAFASAQYRHTTAEEILQVLRKEDDFGIEEDEKPRLDGSFEFPWFETHAQASGQPPLLGRRVLAQLKLTPTTLEIEATSQQRLDNCRRRLEQLLADRIDLVATETKAAGQVLREPGPRAEPRESAQPMPPPELIAELEEKMLRQWIDESIPALDGLTPREAVKTPEGRRQVLELIEYAVQMQRRMPKTPRTFAPDYRKVKKMLGLE
jgi:hypothetical protein